jgi:hypothetical protein
MLCMDLRASPSNPRARQSRMTAPFTLVSGGVVGGTDTAQPELGNIVGVTSHASLARAGWQGSIELHARAVPREGPSGRPSILLVDSEVLLPGWHSRRHFHWQKDEAKSKGLGLWQSRAVVEQKAWSDGQGRKVLKGTTRHKRPVTALSTKVYITSSSPSARDQSWTAETTPNQLKPASIPVDHKSP